MTKDEATQLAKEIATYAHEMLAADGEEFQLQQIKNTFEVLCGDEELDPEVVVSAVETSKAGFWIVTEYSRSTGGTWVHIGPDNCAEVA